MSQKPPYHSYLLRIWQTTDRGIPIWRASLESPCTGERQGFATLEALYAYLQQSTHKPSRESGSSSHQNNDAGS